MNTTYIVGATGGAGATTLTLALALTHNGTATALTEAGFVDLHATAGQPTDLAPLTFGDGPTYVDCGRTLPDDHTDHDLIIVARGPSYLALRNALTLTTTHPGARIVVVTEPGRALTHKDAADVLGTQALAVIAHDPSIARAADAGLLTSRLPRALANALPEVAP